MGISEVRKAALAVFITTGFLAVPGATSACAAPAAADSSTMMIMDADHTAMGAEDDKWG